MTETPTFHRTVARTVIALTVLLSGVAFVTGGGAAAAPSSDVGPTNSLVDGDVVTCEGCPCPTGLVDKLGANCAAARTDAEPTTAFAAPGTSPDCVDCVPECVVRIVETRGKDLTCPA